MRSKLIAICACCIIQAAAVVKAADDTEIPKCIIEMTEKYPETKVLIEYYYEAAGDPRYGMDIDVSDDLATDDVPLFIQWDKRWAFLNYGRTTPIAVSGCAPVCLSMALCHFTKDTSLHPKAVADFSFANHYYIERSGTLNTLFTDGAPKLGLDCESIIKDVAKMRECLDEGRLIVALMGCGSFTQSGHFIIIKGYDGGGRFLINDPNSFENSRRHWECETILFEAKQLWSLGLSLK